MNGAVYLPGERVQYYSVSQKEWYKATICRKDPVRHEYIVKLDGSNNMKSATWKKLRPLFEKNDDVEYYSASKLAWYPAKIVSSTYAKDGTIEISVDKTIRHAQNEQLRRRRGPPKGMPVGDSQPYHEHRQKYSQIERNDMAEAEEKDSKDMYNKIDFDDMVKSGKTTAAPAKVGHNMRSPSTTHESSANGAEAEETPYDNNYQEFHSSAFPAKPQPEMTRAGSSEKMRSGLGSPVLRKTRSANPELETEELVAKVYCLRLTPEEDLLKSINAWAEKHRVAAGYVQACVGSTGTTVLRPAGASTTKKFEGKFEIVSLSGTVSTNGSHLHLCIS